MADDSLAIAEFLQRQERRQCVLLNAVLTVQQCEHNSKSGRILSCDGCPGLGEIVMPPKKSETIAAAAGRKSALYKKRKASASPGAETEVPFAALLPDPPAATHRMPEEYHMDMMLDELRRVFDARLDMWRQELLEARTVREQAQYFISMCSAVDNLGW